jgi:hypothetical protein
LNNIKIIKNTKNRTKIPENFPHVFILGWRSFHKQEFSS